MATVSNYPSSCLGFNLFLSLAWYQDSYNEWRPGCTLPVEKWGLTVHGPDLANQIRLKFGEFDRKLDGSNSISYCHFGKL